MADMRMATAWTRQGAWDGIVGAGRAGHADGPPGIVATLREGLHLATVFGPGADGTGARHQDGVTLVWSGPDQTLALSERPDLLDHLADVFPNGAISDQTGGRAVVTLAGPDVRRVLSKGVMVDLHPAAFPPGSAIVTTIAYTGVQIWREPDGDAFTIAVPASYAASFWSWLDASAAEFGLETRLNPRS